MKLEPMIKARFQKFKEEFELQKTDDPSAFEIFINHAILSGHQPDVFSSDLSLLESTCVGGTNDMGIDGISIKLNGLLIKSIQEAEDIIKKFRRVSVEFIFIQSKMRSEFDSGEFIKFTAGVRDFLSEEHNQPRNKKIDMVLAIKDYLLSDEVVAQWESNPSVRLYYVSMGTWNGSEHIEAHKKQFQNDIKTFTTYGECEVHFVDSTGIKTICDRNENTFSATLEAIDTMPLTDVKDVSNSCIAICYASEFLKLLTTEEGFIRKSLFEDNVRDFQGPNNVNEEIRETIANEPEKFCLLNNGITIVCDEYNQSNRRLTLKNPQIVNGCQTSHILFFCQKEKINISATPLHIKIISTTNLDITNKIVRGTNRQSIVYDEAFEGTKRFHRELEEFFDAISIDHTKIYYERRSKQYQHDPRIKQSDKINLKTLTQCTVSILLNEPHMSHRHEIKLLEDFGNSIFQTHQSKLPYYTAALMYMNAEKIFKSNHEKYQKVQSFKPHILMALRENAFGQIPNINKEKKIDDYCKKILEKIQNNKTMETLLDKAITIFDEATEHWIKNLNRSADGRKDIHEFTKLILDKCGSHQEKPLQNDLNFGILRKIITDRNGYKCGFIAKMSGDIFFHSKNSPNFNPEKALGKMVAYDTETTKDGKIIAKNLTPISEIQ